MHNNLCSAVFYYEHKGSVQNFVLDRYRGLDRNSDQCIK